MRIHILGPIAWDTIVELPSVPRPGEFTHASRSHGRPGGQGLNVATALQSAGCDVFLHSYLGKDDSGKKLEEFLVGTGLNLKYIKRDFANSPHVLVMVDNSGERTMVGLAQSYLQEIRIDFNAVSSGDMVIWPVWHENFHNDLIKAKEIGARTVIGLRGISDSRTTSDLLVTTHSEAQQLTHDSRFEAMYISQGSEGATVVAAGNLIHCEAPQVNSIDSTGAGDAFLAGVILGQVWGKSADDSLKIGIFWGSFAAECASSIPPAFSDLQLRFENESVLAK